MFNSSKVLDLQLKPVWVMGILNVTPDSFSDGGDNLRVGSALTHARKLIAEGADILDIGGESTRPGARAVSVSEELQRVIPVIEALKRDADFEVPISVDTSKPEVMREALLAGAGMINDVTALRAEGAVEICARMSPLVCLMHMSGSPRTMQQHPVYNDVYSEVSGFLQQRAEHCIQNGIRADRIVLDPGIGFGKNLQHNMALLKQTTQLAAMGYPLLIGVSRKSLFGDLFKLPVNQRLVPSVVTAVLSAIQGAKVLRVHDVAETVQGLRLATETGLLG